MISNFFQLPSPLEEISHGCFREKGIALYAKRDDLIHPEISGNKWRKLQWNVAHAKQRGHHTLLTFGGAHSNHIAATAAAARHFGLKSIGIIRGEDADINNPTLLAARKNGMTLHKVSRAEFKRADTYDYHSELKLRFGGFYAIAQGGANLFGMQGCMNIIKELPFIPNRIFVACGTGTTAAGMVAAGTPAQIHGIAVLKGGTFLNTEVEKHLNALFNDAETESTLLKNFHLDVDHHFGGYAKVNPKLIEFMRSFYSETGIILDPVYTAKSAYAMTQACTNYHGNKPEKWVFLHTGGLQGIDAMEAKLGEKIYTGC